jgi:hypothetical protein
MDATLHRVQNLKKCARKSDPDTLGVGAFSRVKSRFFAIVRIHLFHKVFLHPRSLPNFKVGFRNHLIGLTVWKVKV